MIKAWKAVLPKQIPVLAVGGVTLDNMQAFVEAGAAGFGIGGSLYRPGDDVATVAAKARQFIDAMGPLDVLHGLERSRTSVSAQGLGQVSNMIVNALWMG